ncbi:MAG: hypothetical protein AAB729_03545 [Patescibacteria group bacterium]
MKKTIIASVLVIIMSLFSFTPTFAPKAKAFEPVEYCDYAVYILFNTSSIKPANEQAYYDAVTWAYDFVRIQGCSI